MTPRPIPRDASRNPNLIECPDCGHHASLKATLCPNCGCPIAALLIAQAREREEAERHAREREVAERQARERKEAERQARERDEAEQQAQERAALVRQINEREACERAMHEQTTEACQEVFRRIALHNNLMSEAEVDALLYEVDDPELAINRLVERQVLTDRMGAQFLAVYHRQVEGQEQQSEPSGESATMVLWLVAAVFVLIAAGTTIIAAYCVWYGLGDTIYPSK